MQEAIIMPPTAKYFKKLRDKKLKRLYKEAIQLICSDPSVGEEKKGDLSGGYGYNIFYNRTNYELAYTIEENEKGEIVIVILAGTRENFYEQLKKYWND